MPTIAVQTTLKMTSNVSADFAVNTMHFVNTDREAGADDIDVMIPALYDDLRPYFSSDVAQNGHTIKMYDLTEPTPRYPYRTTTYNFTSAPGGAPLPHAVAICMSFQADRLSGVSQARRRGRIYIGPLNATQLTGGGRPSSTLINAVNTAASNLSSASISLGTDWVVYSQTLGTGAEVTNGWCDDVYDIQRRRAREATSRALWS